MILLLKWAISEKLTEEKLSEPVVKKTVAEATRLKSVAATPLQKNIVGRKRHIQAIKTQLKKSLEMRSGIFLLCAGV